LFITSDDYYVIITTNIPENRSVKYIKKEVVTAQERCERGQSIGLLSKALITVISSCK
jgi:hypothetical protein